MIQLIREFLGLKRFAIAGLSHSPDHFSRTLWREFRARSYEVVPVNPSWAAIDGERCYARVQEVVPPVEGVLLMTPPAATGAVVRDCAEAGVKLVWMYRAGGIGAVSPEAVGFCSTHHITVIPGECPMMFLDGAGWVHQAHGWVRRITGRYPS
jgi:predicted CoA-binding protein